MSPPTCICGEIVSSDREIALCTSDQHRRAKLRLARARLEVLEVAHRDEHYFEALAELTFLESQSTRTPDAADVIDPIHTIEHGISILARNAEHRPAEMIVGEATAAAIRKIGKTFPAILGLGRVPLPPEGWIGQIGGVDIHERSEDSRPADTPSNALDRLQDAT